MGLGQILAPKFSNNFNANSRIKTRIRHYIAYNLRDCPTVVWNLRKKPPFTHPSNRITMASERPMTFYHPHADAPDARPVENDFTPSTSHSVEQETIVPVYARKPVKKKGPGKGLLIAAPVIAAGVLLGGWALMSGDGREEPSPLAPATTAETSTARLARTTTAPEAVTSTLPAEPAAGEPRVVETAAATPPAPRAAAPAPRTRAAPARRTSAARAPSAAAAADSAPATPIRARPYEASPVTPVAPTATAPIVTPDPVTAPPTVAPTPVLPTSPAPAPTPPATTTPPDQPGG